MRPLPLQPSFEFCILQAQLFVPDLMPAQPFGK